MGKDEFVRVPRGRLQEIIQVRAGLTGIASADDRMNRMSEIAGELLIPPESAQTEGAIVAWRKDNYEGKPIAITVEDLATQPEFVKELWKDAQPLYTICQCPQCGAGKEGA